MKNPFVILASTLLAALLWAHPAGAVNKHNTGCGLGYYFFKDAQSTFATELTAVSTNSLGTQTTGILTETFYCTQPKDLAEDKRLNEFVATNMDSLASDMASGHGESLDTLAELMMVPETVRPDFYTKLHGNFNHIFTSNDIQATELIENIIRAVS